MSEVDFEERYALETRAEAIKLVSAGHALRRGETDTTEIGQAASSDAVVGQESLQVGGSLRESARSSLVEAARLQTQVSGKLAMSAGSDTTLIGGALAETHAGAVLLTAGMSDDLVAGGGARLTALADLWLTGLAGLEEKIGSAIADGALVEVFGTHFEREYGAGNHTAGFASFSGTVWTTTATGFRPLFKVASGVRNLTAGGGAGALGPDAPAGGAPPADAIPPPASGPPPGGGLLGETPEVAAAGDLAAGTDPADVADATRQLQTLEQASGESARSPEVIDDLAQARDLAASDAIGPGTANAAITDEDAKALLDALAARRQRARKDADWTPLIWLSRAGEELRAKNVELRPLLERHLNADDIPDLGDLAKFREALARARDAAEDPSEIARIAGMLADYDDFARRLVDDVFADVDAAANRFPALADDVDGAAVRSALEDARQEKLDQLANVGDALTDEEIVAQAQMVVDQQDYLSAYGLAAKTITAGNDPVSRLDEEIAYVRYTIGVTVGREKVVALQARAARLEDARNHVQRLIQVHSRLRVRPPTDFRSLRAVDEWRFLRNSTDLYRRSARPAVVHFEGSSADFGTLEDRSLDASAGDPGVAASGGSPPPAEWDPAGISQDGNYPRPPVRLPSDVEDDDLMPVADKVSELRRETLTALVDAHTLSTSSPLEDYATPGPELASGALGRRIAIRATLANPFVGGVLSELADEGIRSFPLALRTPRTR